MTNLSTQSSSERKFGNPETKPGNSFDIRPEVRDFLEPSEQIDFARMTMSRREASLDVEKYEKYRESFGIFASTRKNWLSLLEIAYPVYLCVLSDVEEVWSRISENGTPNRQRAPSRSAPETTVIQYIAKPQNLSDRKTCSEYGKMLIWAAAHRIAIESFATDMVNIPLDECKKFARQSRDGFKTIKQNFIQVRVGSGKTYKREISEEMLAEIEAVLSNADHYAGPRELFKALYKHSSVTSTEVLRATANEILLRMQRSDGDE